jgi:hypothetical protein
LVGARNFLASSYSVRKYYPKLDSEGCVILGGMTTSSPGKRSRCGDEYIARDWVLHTIMLIITTRENGRGKSTGYDLCFSGIKT